MSLFTLSFAAYVCPHGFVLVFFIFFIFSFFTVRSPVRAIPRFSFFSFLLHARCIPLRLHQGGKNAASYFFLLLFIFDFPVSFLPAYIHTQYTCAHLYIFFLLFAHCTCLLILQDDYDDEESSDDYSEASEVTLIALIVPQF